MAEKKKKSCQRPKKKKTKASILKQSSPPRVPLHDLFPAGDYPAGELLGYGTEPVTTTGARASELRLDGCSILEDSTVLKDYRKAAEVQGQVHQWVQESVRPGWTLTDIAVGIEDSVRALLDNTGLEPWKGFESGLAFPTGLSLNNCVAQFTPNPGQKEIIPQQEDVMKVDFGVHVNGWIVDSAFTMTFDPTYDKSPGCG